LYPIGVFYYQADELIPFAQRGGYVKDMLGAAAEMTLITYRQWKAFAKTMKDREAEYVS